MKLVYVILHYKVFSITKECVDYLLNQNCSGHAIVVVDNNSDNGSFEKLKEQFQGNDKIYLASIEFNLGFAKANDLGYQIAKHRFGADIVVIMNNDVMITDAGFSTKLASLAKNNAFDILGPDIINKTGEHQNPYVDYMKDERELDRYIRKLRIKKALLPILYRFKKNHDIKHIRESADPSVGQSGVALHGACIIFGKRFIDRYEYPFYPETFLYGEEDILYYFAQLRGLSAIYHPDLVVHHMEDVSTDSIITNRKEKRLFEISNTLKSMQILRKLMKE